MTDQHVMRLCPSCGHSFATDRTHELCMNCLMLTFEQADFTGVAKPHETPLELFAKPNDPLTVKWFDEAAPFDVDDYWRMLRSIHGDDATPTQRLDTDGGDDA